MPNAAVIDIGSNSIKALVAERTSAGRLLPKWQQAINARISAGIHSAAPRLSEAGMRTGIDAIVSLLAAIEGHAPDALRLVATSAVRDALNGTEFCERVRASTGQTIRILSGKEEAQYIGRGLACDPAMAAMRDFTLFDLGGGSLECLNFENAAVSQARSLQLGCVRLTERFAVGSPGQAIDDWLPALRAHVATVTQEAGVRPAPGTTLAIATGGTMHTIRAILGNATGPSIEQASARLEVAAMQTLFHRLAVLPLEERKQTKGLPPCRADVFPAAMAIFLTLADLFGIIHFQHSLYNLRHGIAAEMLHPTPDA